MLKWLPQAMFSSFSNLLCLKLLFLLRLFLVITYVILINLFANIF